VLQLLDDAPPASASDLPTALLGLLVLSLFGAMVGMIAGIVAGLLPALVAGPLLTWAEHRRLIRGWRPWLLAGAILGPAAAWVGGTARDSGEFASIPVTLFASLLGGAAGAAAFRRAWRFFTEDDEPTLAENRPTPVP
jgi:uncharacterized membrane protein YeaQ/YmgE (transglycosylase-associated protein family)